MSGSGNKRMLLQTRERLTSSDHNRLQAFESADIASVLRFMFDATTLTDENADGVETVGDVIATPTRGTILNGIRPRPILASTSLLIDPGVACLVDPDAAPDPDDIPYKWVIDPGILTLGTLTLTPGAGSTRIDVIECQRTDTLLESQTRDVFNSGTGLFSPLSIEKVRAGRLTYRIRLGTPGAGYPGSVSGWLPLAVASVPPAAADWDVVTLWDVRPMAVDAINAPFPAARTLPVPKRLLGFTNRTGNVLLRGVAESSFGSRRAGGALPTAGIDVQTIGTTFHEPGFAFPVNGLFHVWAAFPLGLPRWCKYSVPADGAPRRPLGFRGIPIVTTKGPLNMTGNAPTSAITLPSGLGFGAATTSVAAHVWSGITVASAPLDYMLDGSKIHFADGVALAPSVVTGNVSAEYNLVDNVHHPANARAVYAQIFTRFTSTAAQAITIDQQVQVYEEGNIGFLAEARGTSIFANFTAAAQIHNSRAIFRIPLRASYPFNHGAAPFTRRILHTFNGGTATASLHALTVMGWEMGP